LRSFSAGYDAQGLDLDALSAPGEGIVDALVRATDEALKD